MTPDHTKGGYYCGRSKIAPGHGRGTIQQRAILPLVRAEADRLQIPYDAVELGQDDVDGRESTAERKRRLGLAFAAGALDEATFRAELAAVDEQVAKLDAAADILKVPALDWTAPPAIVNAALHAIFQFVQLGPEMTIAEIRWRVPEWRA
jgi:hypothetical protein